MSYSGTNKTQVRANKLWLPDIVIVINLNFILQKKTNNKSQTYLG